jgi:hypothetical protein
MRLMVAPLESFPGEGIIFCSYNFFSRENLRKTLDQDFLCWMLATFSVSFSLLKATFLEFILTHQDCIDLTHKGEVGPHHATWILACVVGPFSHPMAFPVDLFFTRSSIFQKNDVAKRFSPFDAQKVPETQKEAKK